MAENKMAEVAALFGKKLGEKFKVDTRQGVYNAYFSENGFIVISISASYWDYVLADLLTGEAVIIDE